MSQYNQLQRDVWNQNQMMKKDFLIIPIYILFQMLIPIGTVFGTLGLTAMVKQRPPAQFLYNLSLSVGFVLAQFLTLFAFFVMHKFDIAQVMKRQFHYAKQYTIHITISIVIVLLGLLMATWLLGILNFGPTQYERRVEGLFNYPSALFFTFISMVVLRPMIEVLIYKHVLIHELRKKWHIVIVIILSIFIEVLVHVYDMINVMEMLPYLIIAIGSTFVYLKSGMNLAAAYLFQAGIQLIIFIVFTVKFLLM